MHRAYTGSNSIAMLAGCLMLAGCGAGSGGGTGGSSGSGGGTPPQSPLAIDGLPSAVSNASTVALRVDPGISAAEVTWSLDRGDGFGPAVVATGPAVDIALPEGELTISVRAVYADGSARRASAALVVDRTDPRIVVETIVVRGSTSLAARVVVRGVTDADGRIDTSFRVAFACDGAGSATSLPVDGGDPADWDLPIMVDGRTYGLRIMGQP